MYVNNPTKPADAVNPTEFRNHIISIIAKSLIVIATDPAVQTLLKKVSAVDIEVAAGGNNNNNNNKTKNNRKPNKNKTKKRKNKKSNSRKFKFVKLKNI